MVVIYIGGAFSFCVLKKHIPLQEFVQNAVYVVMCPKLFGAKLY